MADVPLDAILLTEDADMAKLEAQLLENTALNYSRDEAAALCTTLYVLSDTFECPYRFVFQDLMLNITFYVSLFYDDGRLVGWAA